jgi:hypothetical protein
MPEELKNMNFKKYYDKAMAYEDYVSLLGENLKMHQVHCKRFEKDITEEEEKHIKAIKPVNILVLTEPWCGDSLAVLPVVRKVAEINGSLFMKVLRRDENLDLMDQFLTRGGRAVPLFFFLADDYSLIFKWGPRPQAAQDIFVAHRQQLQEGTIEKMEVIKRIRNFYSKNRGKAILSELMLALKENHLI